MLAFAKMLATFALICCLLQSITAMNTNTAIRSGGSQPIARCNEYIEEIVEGIYDNNFDNFDKVIEFAHYSSSPNFKADVLCALYNVMEKAEHIRDPLRALPLYNEIENLINTSGTNLYAEQLDEMESLRDILLWKNIVPNGSDILQAGVYLSTCAHENTTVGHLLDELDPYNQTVSDITITRMVNTVHWILPTEELISIFGNFSNHLRQNVYAMLALYNEEELQGDLQMKFFLQLFQLQQNPEYNATVLAETQQRVDAIFPFPLKNLLGGDVCLTQRMSNGSWSYLEECYYNVSACVYVYSRPGVKNVFQVARKEKELIFNFKNQYYNRKLVLDPILQPRNINYNVFFRAAEGDTNWKVQLEGNTIVLHNMNSTLFLCAAGSVNTVYTRYSATFPSYAHECKWYVDNC